MTDIRTETRALFARRPHWSELASALGQIEDRPEQVRAWGFVTVRQWAEADLGLTGRGYETLSRLWQAMKTWPSDAWPHVSRTRTSRLLNLLRAGGARSWIDRAATAPQEEWDAQTGRALGTSESWQTWRVRLPASSALLRDAALAVAAEACGVAEEKIHDPAVEHGLLEWCWAKVLA